MTKAIIYIRVSTGRQVAEGESLEMQEKRLAAYCQAQNLEVHEIIRDEGVSAKIPLAKRPGGQRLLAQLGPAVPNVVVLKFDRMFRNTLDALTTIAAFKESGIHLHALDFGGSAIDTSTALGQLIVTMRAGFAQMERDICRERVLDTFRHKRAKGETLGQTPFGFTNVEGDLVPDPRRPKVLDEIMAMHKAGKGVRVIADIISSDYGAPFLASHSTIHRLILKQPKEETTHA